MRFPQSDVFDAFAEICQKEGLITKTASEATPNNPRAASDTEETIKMLYNVRPNGEDDDILDQAHPEPVVIAPSYDRLNGLVENLKERQNVMVGVARKPTNGVLVGRKYAAAQQELLNELIQLGFEMERKDQDELRSLADTCALELVKEAESKLL